MSSIFTDFELSQMKRAAKTVQRSRGCIYSHALDVIAKEHGYGSWALLQKNNTSRIRQSPEVKAAYDWFLAHYYPATSRYYTPVVSPEHILKAHFGDGDVINVAARMLCLEGNWTSAVLEEVNNKVAHPYKKRRIADRYAPCRVFEVRERGKHVDIVVPVLRTHPPLTKWERERGYAGQLVFRCPFCGGIHFHGGGAMEFGAGNGQRVPHCDSTTYRYYSFYLVEQSHKKYVGHLRKGILEDCFAPDDYR